ncbi:hypothetical protein [Sorangium sp. So ce388]|uniref:hypothetical protein n=1 Tax=Sorangium sp. So ce388 TaxID=3133309 RepID=UPI003F5BDA78
MHTLAFVLIGLPACAALQQQYRDMYCNGDGAYRKGYNDAKEDKPQDTELVPLCLPEQRAVAGVAYTRGYREGTAARDRAAASAPPTAASAPPTIVLVPPPFAGVSQGNPAGEVAVERGSGDCFFGEFMTLRNHNTSRAISATVLQRETAIVEATKEHILHVSLAPGDQRDLGCSKPSPGSPEFSWQVTGAQYAY